MKIKNRPLGSHKNVRLIGMTVLILFVCSSFMRADGEILTFESAIHLALSRNERALSADQLVVAADARLTKARAFFLPNINVTGTYTRRPFEVVRIIGNSQIIIQSLNALSGVVALNLTIFDAHSIPALRQADLDKSSQQFASADSKRQLAFEVGNAFLTTLSVDQVLEASQHRFDFAKQTLDAAKARYSAGLVSVNDVTRADLEYATAEMGIIQVKGQVETTWLQLGYLLDDPTAIRKKLEIPDFLLKTTEDNPLTVEQLIAEAQTRRLDLNSLRWHAKAQRALILEPTLRWLPSLSLTGQYRYTNEAGLTGKNFNWNAGLTFSWAIFDGLTRNGDYSERKALAYQADLDVQAGERKVELDVRDALVSLTNQRASLKLAMTTYDVAKRNAAETAELYKQGLSTVLQVADANVRLFEAEVGFVQARYGLGIAYLNLEAALGLDPFGKEPKL